MGVLSAKRTDFGVTIKNGVRVCPAARNVFSRFPLLSFFCTNQMECSRVSLSMYPKDKLVNDIVLPRRGTHWNVS